jgi:hypothetical protein
MGWTTPGFSGLGALAADVHNRANGIGDRDLLLVP